MRCDLQGWLPYRLHERTQDIGWRYVGDTQFTDPFFDETLGRCLSLPENSFGPPRTTSLAKLEEVARSADAIEPSAFLFHVSRCGSTLVSQLLGLDDTCITLSEVPLFDELLRARFRPALAGIVDVTRHLPAAIRLHGQRRLGTERCLFIKLDSWHIAFHAELRALYPRTPFILLYREPSAIMRSHQRQPGMHAIPGLIENAVFGFPPGDTTSESFTSHLPRVLASYYETFLTVAQADSRTLLVEYQADMLPVVEAIVHFAGIDLTTAHRQKMHARAAFHGKAPATFFRGDPTPKSDAFPMHSCLARYEALQQWSKSAVLPISRPF